MSRESSRQADRLAKSWMTRSSLDCRASRSSRFARESDMTVSTPRSMRNNASVSDLAEQVRAGNVRAVSRLITLLESHDRDGRAALDLLVPHSPHATVIGITGYPGAGKSTVVAQLITAY